MHNPSHMFEFVGVGEIAETTTQLLSFNLNSAWSKSSSGSSHSGIEEVERLVFQQARDYLGEVREGFTLSVRSSDIPDSYQLRYLLDRVLFDWESFGEELGLQEEPDALVDSSAASAEGVLLQNSGEPPKLERLRKQLLAFGMAAVALGALPKLPSDQVTFPHSYGNPPTYADISAPSSPAEMLIRIEEIEEMIGQMMANTPGQLVQKKYGSVRRTYGFFETSAWLVRKDAQRFGIKKQDSSDFRFF